MKTQTINKLSFQEALTQTYMEHPCQVLPNALWKTRNRLEELEKDYLCQADSISQLAIWSEREMYAFWSRERRSMDFPYDRFSHADLMLVHQDYISTIDFAAFSDRKSYFRLSYTGARMPEVPVGWRIREAAQGDETEAVAEFIRNCYPGSTIQAETVQRWEQYTVHDPSLWVWVENAAGTAMGLGIAEFDPIIGEGSLEWIQVLPKFRRLGVGQTIVATLVRRLRPQSVLITVSGRMESESRPGMLYRKCGFSGTDIWWVLRKKMISP